MSGVEHLAMLSTDQLFSRYEGYAALYIQSGNEVHLSRAEEAKAEINSRIIPFTIVKRKGKRTTVIELDGERFVWDSGSTFRGGVKRK